MTSSPPWAEKFSDSCSIPNHKSRLLKLSAKALLSSSCRIFLCTFRTEAVYSTPGKPRSSLLRSQPSRRRTRPESRKVSRNSFPPRRRRRALARPTSGRHTKISAASRIGCTATPRAGQLHHRMCFLRGDSFGGPFSASSTPIVARICSFFNAVRALKHYSDCCNAFCFPYLSKFCTNDFVKVSKCNSEITRTKFQQTQKMETNKQTINTKKQTASMPYPVSCPSGVAAGVRTSLCRLPSSAMPPRTAASSGPYEAPISPLSGSVVKPAKTGVMYQNASWYLVPVTHACERRINDFSQCNRLLFSMQSMTSVYLISVASMTFLVVISLAICLTFFLLCRAML